MEVSISHFLVHGDKALTFKKIATLEKAEN